MRSKALSARRKHLADLAAKDAANRCASCKVVLPKQPVPAADGRQFCSLECLWDADERLERMK